MDLTFFFSICFSVQPALVSKASWSPTLGPCFKKVWWKHACLYAYAARRIFERLFSLETRDLCRR